MGKNARQRTTDRHRRNWIYALNDMLKMGDIVVYNNTTDELGDIEIESFSVCGEGMQITVRRNKPVRVQVNVKEVVKC